MQISYDTEAPKRATNLNINSDLLNQARAEYQFIGHF